MTGIKLYTEYSPGLIKAQFEGLVGNRPAEYGNCLALWTKSADLYADHPIIQQPLLGMNSEGEDTIDLIEYLKENYDESESEYQIGYCTGGVQCSIGALASFGESKNTRDPSNAIVQAVDLAKHSATVYWESFSGNKAKTNRNWIALWEGDGFRWDGLEMLSKKMIEEDEHQGHTILDSLNLERGEKYTIAYATGPTSTNIAATSTFTFS